MVHLSLRAREWSYLDRKIQGKPPEKRVECQTTDEKLLKDLEKYLERNP